MTCSEAQSLPASTAGRPRVCCAEHPARTAVAACSSCGEFVCMGCDRLGAEGFEVYCAACRPELHAVAVVPEPAEAAGFGHRLAAYLFDGLVLDGVRSLVMAGLGWELQPAQGEGLARFLLLAALLSAIYHVFCWVRFGATPGKALLGLRVVRTGDDGPVSVRAAMLRWGGYLLSSLPFGYGFIAMLSDPERRTWHDRLSGTRVVRAR